MMKYKNIMFDLDGTVTDSGRAIMSSVEYALEHFGKTEDMIKAGATFKADSVKDIAEILLCFPAFCDNFRI